MENLSCDDLLDLGLMELFDDHRYILENVPNLSSAYPTLGRDSMSSSIKVLHGLPTQVPSPKFFRVDYAPSPLEDNSNSNSYFLVAENPLPIFSYPVELKFFGPGGITLHHQLVSLTKI